MSAPDFASQLEKMGDAILKAMFKLEDTKRGEGRRTDGRDTVTALSEAALRYGKAVQALAEEPERREVDMAGSHLERDAEWTDDVRTGFQRSEA